MVVMKVTEIVVYTFKEGMEEDAREAMMSIINKTQSMMSEKRQRMKSGMTSGQSSAPQTPMNTTGQEQPENEESLGGKVRKFKSVDYIGAKDNRTEFYEVWSRKIEMFVADHHKLTMELPAELSANDRRELHTLADKFNLGHHSSGTGADRRLVLKKDVLHFKAPDILPSKVELGALQEKQASGKTSKFQLRRVRRDEGSQLEFEDEGVSKALRRLDRATDQFSKAVDVGQTLEEIANPQLLSIAPTTGDTHGASGVHGVPSTQGYVDGPSINSEWKTTLVSAAATSAADGVVKNESGASISTEKKLYFEECTGCKTQVAVDYDLSKWDCVGYCAECRKDSIWRLVEKLEKKTVTQLPTQQEVLPIVKEGYEGEEDEKYEVTAADDNLPGRKRGRSHEDIEGEDVKESQQRERVDKVAKSEDEIAVCEEEEEMTIDAALDMARMNDFPPEDVEWIESYLHGMDSKNISRRLEFAIEFGDSVEERHSAEDSVFIHVKGIRDKPISFLLSKVVTVSNASPSVDDAPLRSNCDALKVVFLNVSAYASTPPCLIIAPMTNGDRLLKVLESLKVEFGSAHISYGSDFDSVLRAASL